jgi:polysaccharide export outer membrane protein
MGNLPRVKSILAFKAKNILPVRSLSAVLALAAAMVFHAMPALAQGAAGVGAAGAAPGATGVAPAAGQGPTATAPGARTNNTTQTDAARQARDTHNNDQNEHRNEVPAGSQDLRTEFQQMVEATTGRRLPIYGASLFGNVPSTFAPIDNVPIGPGYILGPGDDIVVQMTGQVDRQMEFTIDRTGAVGIPGIGTVHVAGLPYSQLNSYLTQQFNKDFRNFTLDARLGSLRTIQVFVTGQARRPGSYTISSLSTLLNGVFASGGPLPQGSVRDIQVIRGGAVIEHFDLYDLLLKGEKTHDIALATGDVIFIPPVGPQVAVLGSIDNPAIFELKGATSVADAIHLAGGETAVAAGSVVRLERIFDHAERSLQDVTLTAGRTDLLQNGDIISVTSVIDRFRNAVTLRGNVANPGRYVWHPGMRISDLIPNKEALITRNYWRKRNELGQLAQDYIPDNATAPSSAVGEGALQAKGNEVDRNSDNLANKGNASGSPGGNSVGSALTGDNSTFHAKTDIILSAPDIYWGNAEIERQNPADLTTSLILFNLGSIVLDNNPAQNYELQPGDVVTIFSKSDLRVPSAQQTKFVRLEGEFNAVGVFSVLPGETLRGLLRRVGGFTPDAYLYASEFTRESTRRVEQQRLVEYADELSAQISAVTASNRARSTSAADDQAAAASAADAQSAVNRLRQIQPIGRIVIDFKPNSVGIDAVPDLALEDGDRFVVPRIPASINVEGQVYNSNAFVYLPNQRVIDYLRRAGGPDREADKKRMFLLRADGSVISRQYADVARAGVYPGDTIVVPPIIDKRAVLQRILDIANIVGNLGFGVAAIDVLARN